MPLLHRKPFIKQKPPADLQPDEEIFFCEPTKEVFRNYDEFFERMILCNSLLWSCEITGRYSLTYSEAEQSERAAKTTVNSIQPELKKPLLLLCSMMYKTGLKDLVAEVLRFIRERFFLGENVQIQKDNTTWVSGSVRSVSLASDQQQHPTATNGLSHTDDLHTDLAPAAAAAGGGGGGGSSSSAGVEVNGDSSSASDSRGARSGGGGGSGAVSSAATSTADQLQYRVCLADGTVRCVPASRVRRDRRAIGYDRLRMLYRQCTRPDPGQAGRICVRPAVARKLRLHELAYGDVFPVGSAPEFSPSATLAAALAAAAKGTSSNGGSDGTGAKTPLLFDEQDDTPLAVVRSVAREKVDDERRRLNELRLVERDRRRLHKKQLQHWLKEWTRPRDDLLCEDHKELPVFAPVSTRLTGAPAQFGSCLQLVEFVNAFRPLLVSWPAELAVGSCSGSSSSSSSGLSLSTLQSVLLDNRVDGPFVTLLQTMLRSVFSVQADEDQESGRRDDDVDPVTSPSSAGLIDQQTVTELLRRHLLSGFPAVKDDVARWRLQQKGGYVDSDCPTHEFRRHHAQILHKLSQRHVLYLSPSERLAVLECLMLELLGSQSARQLVDEADSRARELRTQLRALRATIAQLHKAMTTTLTTTTTSDASAVAKERLNGETTSKGVATDCCPASDAHSSSSRADTGGEQLQQLEQAEKQCGELVAQLVATSRRVSVTPLGRDRAYRRYWLLPSVPALLVQHAEHVVLAASSSSPVPTAPAPSGLTCDSLAPHSSCHCERLATAVDRQSELRSLIIDRLRQQLAAAAAPAATTAVTVSTNNNCGLDELLQSDIDLQSVLASMFCANPAVTTPAATGIPVQLDSAFSRHPPLLHKLLLCTADPASCPVHGQQSVPPAVSASSTAAGEDWSYCTSVEQLQQLIECLNPRGVREAELRANIVQMEELVRDCVRRCPVDQLAGSDTGSQQQQQQLQQLQVNGLASGTAEAGSDSSVTDNEELALRDSLLDLEERLYAGSLGSLRVDDRIAWREAIYQRSYDQQCDTLRWGSSPPDVGKSTSASVDGGDGGVACLDTVTPAASHSHMSSATEDHQQQQQQEEEQEQQLMIRSLASALLQVEQGVDRKFLRAPLAAEDAMAGWEADLMHSTSVSQLFVRLSQLDCAVQWQRSALRARCQLCRKKCDPHRMLLCDGCNRGFHLDCLTPPLPSVPEGDWFCVSCLRSDGRAKSAQKRRRSPANISCDSRDRDRDRDSANHSSSSCYDQAAVGVSSPTADSRQLQLSSHPLQLSSTGRRSVPDSNSITSHISAATSSSSARKRRGAGELGPDQFDCAALLELLTSLRHHPASHHFLRPVQAKFAPHYYDVIRRPMDLGTVREKLNAMCYATNEQCLADTALVFTNCCMYNERGSSIHTQALQMRRFFVRRVAELGLQVPGAKRCRNST